MSNKIVIGNWKMNKGPSEAGSFIKSFKKSLPTSMKTIVGIAPPFTSLPVVAPLTTGTPIKIVAQNVHWRRDGAFTGEISPTMLKEIGCKMVIIGHSERREYFGETNQTVNKKIKSAIEHGIDIIFCVGEKLDEREGGKTENKIESQLLEGLDGVISSEIKHINIAYEPVWAIGSGKNATPDQAQEVHKFISGCLSKKFGENVSREARILYGGSVNAENISKLVSEKSIGGVLVGGASLEVESFIKIIKCVDAT